MVATLSYWNLFCIVIGSLMAGAILAYFFQKIVKILFFVGIGIIVLIKVFEWIKGG
jgi:hypothetical protein